MNFEKSLKQAVEAIMKSQQHSPLFIGKVKTISGETCVIERDGYDDLTDVRINIVEKSLQSFFKVTPKQGAEVLVLQLDTAGTDAIIVKCAEIDKIEITAPEMLLNGGQLGGLVVASKLVSKLNTLEQRMSTHQHLYVSPAGSPVQTTPDPATNNPIAPTQEAQITNNKIKH